jgi:hypothetical protein
MSVMFEVLYKAPSDAAREATISQSAGRFGGRLTYREEPEALDRGPICLTFEFPGYEQADQAAAQLRSVGEHVEGPMAYG